MKQLRLTHLILIGAASLLLLYLLFSGGDAGEKSSSNSDRAGESRRDGSSSDSAGSALAGGSSGSAQSIFDSQFFQAGAQEEPTPDGEESENGEEPDILDPAGKNNPINPQTGQQYPDSVMKQFADLREKFPDNSIIPRNRTQEELAQERGEREAMYALQKQINEGQASETDINAFYDFKMKPIKDRLELLNYVLEKSGNGMSEEIKAQYEKILKSNNTTMESYQQQRSNALRRIGVEPEPPATE